MIVFGVILGTCDNCDLQEVQSLSSKLLDALTEASLDENSGPIPSEIVTNSLKDELLTFLGFGRISEPLGDSVCMINGNISISNDISIDLDPSIDIHLIQSRLERGAFLAHIQSKKSAWSKV